MTQQKITDAIESTDSATSAWKSRFAAAKAAYESGELKQCETLLARALEEGKALKEHVFAVNTCLIGQGVVYLAQDNTEKAESKLNEAIRSLAGAGEPALKELYAVALRFHAEVCSEKGDLEGAEQDLLKSLEILETLGVDGAVQLAYAMSDLAIVCLKQNDMNEARDLVLSSMEVLAAALGPETPEYTRTNILYSLCHAQNEEEFLGGINDTIVKVRYQRGRKHPNIVRSVRWYVRHLREQGADEAKIAEIEEQFGVVCKD